MKSPFVLHVSRPHHRTAVTQKRRETTVKWQAGPMEHRVSMHHLPFPAVSRSFCVTAVGETGSDARARHGVAPRSHAPAA